MSKQLSNKEIEEILGNVEYPGFEIRLRYDPELSSRIVTQKGQIKDCRPFIQVFCLNDRDNVTGAPFSWSGRKWLLSRWMVKSEIVRTAFKAVMTAVEHEACEKFKYRGYAIFDPHLDVDRLAVVRASSHCLDTREEPGKNLYIFPENNT